MCWSLNRQQRTTASAAVLCLVGSADLKQSLQLGRWRCLPGQNPEFGRRGALQELLEGAIAPDLAKIELLVLSAGGTWFRRNCIKSDAMERHRKINTSHSGEELRIEALI